jgi:thymidylate kinase
LGSRKACEEVVKKLMKEGKKCVIDRCNHTNHQRNIWVNLMMRFAPRQLNPVALILHLKQNPNVCMQRVLERKGHKTLPPVLSSKSVIDRFALSFEEPSHDRVWVVEDNWIAPLLALAIDLDGAVDMCRRGVSSFKIPTK